MSIIKTISAKMTPRSNTKALVNPFVALVSNNTKKTEAHILQKLLEWNLYEAQTNIAFQTNERSERKKKKMKERGK